MLSLQSFLRKGVSLGHVGGNHNLKDLKDFRGVSRFEDISEAEAPTVALLGV